MAPKKSKKSKRPKSKNTASKKKSTPRYHAKAKTAKKTARSKTPSKQRSTSPKKQSKTSKPKASRSKPSRNKRRESISQERELNQDVRSRGLNSTTARQSDFEGLSDSEQADSESVDELVEEGNAFEAGAVAGVEEADNSDEREVHTHEVPEDDVPEEYLDND